MLYTLAPLERHSDDGFGAVGEAFKTAADKLVKAEESQRIFGVNCPSFSCSDMPSNYS
jgi:hypothetical protein